MKNLATASLPQPIIVDAPMVEPADGTNTNADGAHSASDYDDNTPSTPSSCIESLLNNNSTCHYHPRNYDQGDDRNSTNGWGPMMMVQSPLGHSHSLLDGSDIIDLECTTPSFVDSGAVGGRSDNTTPSSKVDLFGDPSLPSRLMKFRCVSGPVDYPLTRAYEERLLLARRRDRTPLPTERRSRSQSYSDSTVTEIIGDMGGEDIRPIGDTMFDEPVVTFPFTNLRRFPLDESRSDNGHQFTMSDNDDNSFNTSTPSFIASDDSFVATTTGASVGKLTPHSVTLLVSDDVNSLFSRSSSAREMVALDLQTLAPMIRKPQPHRQRATIPPT